MRRIIDPGHAENDFPDPDRGRLHRGLLHPWRDGVFRNVPEGVYVISDTSRKQAIQVPAVTEIVWRE